jgi:hypothetical protein
MIQKKVYLMSKRQYGLVIFMCFLCISKHDFFFLKTKNYYKKTNFSKKMYRIQQDFLKKINLYSAT